MWQYLHLKSQSMIFLGVLSNFSYYVYVCLQLETIKRAGDAEKNSDAFMYG